jgi:hypothetical protein
MKTLMTLITIMLQCLLLGGCVARPLEEYPRQSVCCTLSTDCSVRYAPIGTPCSCADNHSDSMSSQVHYGEICH